MLYTRHNPKWFVRIFELGDGITEELLDFGTLRPDGIIACGVPARFLQKFFRERGMGDNALICENANPSLSSIQLDYERTGFLAARALDDMISGRAKEPPRLVCGMNGITERGSTQNLKGSGRIVSLACEYIAKNACRRGGIDQFDVAKHLGVSVRTL